MVKSKTVKEKIITILLFGGIMMLLFGCGKNAYKVDYCGGQDFYENAKETYKEGEKVTLKYGHIAADTAYRFYLDNEEIDYEYKDEAFILQFTMPGHDIKLECRMSNPMANIKEAPQEVLKNEYKRDSKEMYESFLAGTEPLYFDKENTPYTLDEVLDTWLAQANAYGEDYAIGEVKYAYIDCGQDGEPELAFSFEEINVNTGYPEMQQAYIIKVIDDKLQLCFSRDYGYRAFLTIKDNGTMIYGGSNGAAYYTNIYEMVDKDGKYEYIYGLDTSYNPYDLFYEIDNFDESEYEDVLGNSMYEEYTFRKYDDLSDESYESYLKDAKYVYYSVDEYYEKTDDISVYDSDSDYAKTFALTDRTFVTPDEIEEIINNRLNELSVTQEMLDADEVEWSVLRERLEFDVEGEYDEAENTEYVIENPSWEYTLRVANDDSPKKLKLTMISQEANDITDDAEWFDEIGMTMPDRNTFSDQSFAYVLSGDEQYYPYKAEVIDLGSYYSIATLDFSEHRYADNYVPEDYPYIDEAIKYMHSDGFTLYVSIAHNTYAASAPHNAYVMALDMQNDYSVLWKSQPLVANADNFAIIDDFIICGYGFTAEDDYLYILDKYTGKVLDRILLKSGPDYIYEISDKLYVRTYNTNYVFDFEIIE